MQYSRIYQPNGSFPSIDEPLELDFFSFARSINWEIYMNRLFNTDHGECEREKTTE